MIEELALAVQVTSEAGISLTVPTPRSGLKLTCEVTAKVSIGEGQHKNAVGDPQDRRV